MSFSKLYKLFLLAAASFLGIAAIQNSGGAPPASTGAPSEQTCVSCHMGAALNSGPGTTTITVEGDVTKYEPGKTYNITVRTEQTGIPKFGMQVTALDATNKKAGTLTATGNDLQKTNFNGKEYLTHTSLGNSVSDAKEWNFKWEAPATGGGGTVTFYVAWIASNNNNTNTGDLVYTASLRLDADLSNVGSRQLPENWSLSPNPSEGNFNLHFDMNQPQPVELTVVNTSGQLVLVKNWTTTGHTFNENISLTHLAKGVYMAQVKVGEKQYMERIIIK